MSGLPVRVSQFKDVSKPKHSTSVKGVTKICYKAKEIATK